MKVRGTTSLFADVTVSSTITAVDLTVTGEANLLSKVTVGTVASPADLEVSRRASVRGTSSLLGNVTIGNTRGTAANLLVSGTTEVRGTTSLLSDVTVGSTTSAADLTVTGTTNLQGNSILGNLGRNGALGGNDDSTTIIRGTLDLNNAEILGLSGGSNEPPTSREISNSSSSFNVSSLGIKNGDKLNLFVKLKINSDYLYEYDQWRQISYSSSRTNTYTFIYSFFVPIYEVVTSPSYHLNTLGIVERQLLIDVVITAAGNISIGEPSFRYFSHNKWSLPYIVKRGTVGVRSTEISLGEVSQAWRIHFGDQNTEPTYSSALIISKAKNSN